MLKLVLRDKSKDSPEVREWLAVVERQLQEEYDRLLIELFTYGSIASGDAVLFQPQGEIYGRSPTCQ